MKYVNAFSMLFSLISAFILIQLGFDYVDKGYGLHPYLAGAGFVLVLAMGYKSASLIIED